MQGGIFHSCCSFTDTFLVGEWRTGAGGDGGPLGILVLVLNLWGYPSSPKSSHELLLLLLLLLLILLTSSSLSPGISLPSLAAAPFILMVITNMPWSLATCMLSTPPRMLNTSPREMNINQSIPNCHIRRAPGLGGNILSRQASSYLYQFEHLQLQVIRSY